MMEITETAQTPPSLLEAPRKRCAIIGTASSWKLAPYADPGVDILGLNDGYVLGLPRMSYWFDLHPFHQMVFRPAGQRRVNAWEVPAGSYLRPEGHLDWLRSRPFPVYLRAARPDYPTSRTFPREALEAKYGPYFASTPAWMLVWALEEGYQEIGIYGIHLATDWEYMRQRPNLEFLIGIALQRGVSIVIPNKSPLLKSKWCYAFEAKPDVELDRLQREIEVIKRRGKRLHDRIAAVPWYARDQKADLQGQLRVTEYELQDAQHELQRASQLYHVS